MEYRFWQHKDYNSCLIERLSDGHFYCTEWREYYSTQEGKKFLMPLLKGWSTDAPDTYDLRECYCKGSIEVPDSIMEEKTKGF